MLINQVAKKYDISVRTLRYYEEIGTDLLPIATNESEGSLIFAIKALRKSLDHNYSIILETLRIKDNPNELAPNQYRILQNANIIADKQINTSEKPLQVDHIITTLKSIIL